MANHVNSTDTDLELLCPDINAAESHQCKLSVARNDSNVNDLCCIKVMLTILDDAGADQKLNTLFVRLIATCGAELMAKCIKGKL